MWYLIYLSYVTHRTIDRPSQVGYGHILEATAKKPIVKATKGKSETQNAQCYAKLSIPKRRFNHNATKTHQVLLLRRQEEYVSRNQRKSISVNRYQSVDGLLV